MRSGTRRVFNLWIRSSGRGARSLVAFAGLLAFGAFQGCGNTAPTPPAPGKRAPPPATAAVTKAAVVPPRFPRVEVSIESGGPSCTATFTPQPIGSPVKVNHGLTCGPPGAVTKLSWQYLGTADE